MKAGPALQRFAALPFAPLARVTGGAPPLIVAPHQDDESLGCGGLIAGSVRAGTPPAVVFVTDGSASHPGSRRFDAAARAGVRRKEALAACAILGVGRDRVAFLGLPDGNAPHQGCAFEAAAARLREIGARFGCRSVLAPWVGDPHGDHVAAHRMAAVAARAGRLAHWSYIVWGWTLTEDAEVADEGADGVRVDIAAWLPLKRRAIAAHRSQHGAVFTDDPSGFVLPPALLGYFARPWEVFLLCRAGATGLSGCGLAGPRPAA